MNRREFVAIAAISITVSVAVSATILAVRTNPLPQTIVAQPPVTAIDATGGR